MLIEEDVLVEDDDEVLLKLILSRLFQLRIVSLKIKTVEFNEVTINVIHADFSHKLILAHLTSSDSIHTFMMLHHFLQQKSELKCTHISHKLSSMFQDKHK